MEKTKLERNMSERGRAGGASTEGLSFLEVSTRKHLSCAPGSSLNSAPRVDDVALVSLDKPVTTVRDSFKLSFRGDHGSSVINCQLGELVFDVCGEDEERDSAELGWWGEIMKSVYSHDFTI